ncbi:MAG: hypothetical protein QXX20_08050 [Candidatus Thermoplasmatota archaeon]
MKTFVRSAPKIQEKIILENAKKIYDDPFILLPSCSDISAEKYFKKIRKKLEKICKNRDNRSVLEKYSNKRGFDGAVAGTLLLVHSEKAPFLGVVSFLTGDVTYAQRGKADKEKLIAVQHYNDPMLRLLGFKDIAYKKNLSFYSWDTGFVCSGKTPKPPKEFVDFILKKLDIRCTSDICSYQHQHGQNEFKKEAHQQRFLRIYWKSADTYIAICESCAKKTQNTVFTISKYLLQPKLSEDFDINVIADIVNKETGYEQKTDFLEDYFAGRISDFELIQKNIQRRTETIEKSDQKIYVYNNISYGENIEKFVDALNPLDHERKALLFILEKNTKPLIVDHISANKILERYWKEYGFEFIKSIIPDESIAESFFHLDETPSDIIKLVFEYEKRQKILAQLPQFTSLSDVAQVADTITKTYKIYGETKALNELKKIQDTPQIKSLAYSFLLVFNKAEETKWRFSKEEIEFGLFLKPYVERLLNAEPRNYVQYLKELLAACGSTEELHIQ